ncbi:gliding motility-associated C-terminal domain-containing protein [Maribacter halichondriae]|uniref:gliding motility-associated C-terminal domain-containing protein n=1 Tax=Maribacter halichondriae TaxID=2980554 RepID=UPI002359256A|nr:gliding motility-associated C-terminal domain-containing protein [Maribacter sp. Hal144]
MRIRIIYIVYCLSAFAFSQEAIHNFGDLQIHGQALVGFHTDLINDGDFDKNSGLAGFYGYDKSLTVSGTKSPIFYDAEIVVDNGLYLDTGIGVTNNGNLITGDIITPRTNTSVFPNFIDDAFYVGENDVSLVDGYAAMTNKTVFTFPVGDDERLRPLTITSSSTNPMVKCAYFFESPNTPSTFGKSFQTAAKASEFLSVSEKEFWHLEGNLPVSVTLTWDDWSNVGAFATYISDIKVVGWHKKQKEWVNLGSTDVQGGMAYGSVTSEPLVPNEYEIITLGGNDDKLEEFTTIELDNYFMTPNGDGKNDFLVLDGIEKSSNNTLQIFDRYGILVYSKTNYQNEFNGFSNRNSVINRPSGLASGIYFYLITMNDLKQKHQGYLYLSSKVNN